jgi:hypothetical protein
MTSQLIIERVLVLKASHVLYDELFHLGVNIIHGSNGSGKSTLADFIFFGLGGDLRSWKPYASRAEAVLLQVSTPQGIITTRREVSSEASRPMDIFFGAMDDALKAPTERWMKYSYSRPERGYSFSQILFRAIGLPEAISEGASNLTMHQVLRLLYVDQLTPIQRIFRVDSWDTWQTKQAIGDMLAGVGGYDLYDLQIQLREVEKRYSIASTALKNLISVASGYGEQVLVEHIELSISKSAEERNKLLATIETLDEHGAASAGDDTLKTARTEANQAFRSARRKVVRLKDDIETLTYEIEDAEAFLTHLRQSVHDFDNASLTFVALGRLEFEFCPSCFASVKAKDVKHCQLCNEPHTLGIDDSRTLAVKLDLQMQLKESESLQNDRRDELSKLTADLRVANTELRRASASIDIARSGPVSAREVAVAELSRRIGFIDSQLEVLQRRLELGRKISQLSDEKESLNDQVTSLKAKVSSIMRSQEERRASAYSRISSEAKEILEKDLEEHTDFGRIDYVNFNFAEDWIAINDEKNRAGSASGMVVLKNSFSAAMLFSSIKDSRFCLPRWMLFDNIEDKGMVEERSWNFQRVLVSMSSEVKLPHQIIFTTSKIAPEFADSALVVGRKYTKANPLLANLSNITTSN